MAGGDGTQALVAQVAAEHDVPFLVISAGTRNHFALDLGLDREDPARCLDALRDGVEARIDLGEINGRPFVNNASFGAYAEIVESPAYRDDKRGTTLDTLPDLLSGRRGAHLVGRRRRAGRRRAAGAAGQQQPLRGVRPRRAWAGGPGSTAACWASIAVRVDTARQAVGLLQRRPPAGAGPRAEAREVRGDADEPEIPVGIDGETVRLSTPVRCTIRPGALRVRLPRRAARACGPRGAGWTGPRCGGWRSAGRPPPRSGRGPARPDPAANPPAPPRRHVA